MDQHPDTIPPPSELSSLEAEPTFPPVTHEPPGERCDFCAEADAPEHPARDASRGVKTLWVAATNILLELIEEGREAEVRDIIACLPGDRLSKSLADTDRWYQVELPARDAERAAKLEAERAERATARAELDALRGRWRAALDEGGLDALYRWQAAMAAGEQLPPHDAGREETVALVLTCDSNLDGIGRTTGEALAWWGINSIAYLSDAREAGGDHSEPPATPEEWAERAVRCRGRAPHVLEVSGSAGAVAALRKLVVENTPGAKRMAEDGIDTERVLRVTR